MLFLVVEGELIIQQWPVGYQGDKGMLGATIEQRFDNSKEFSNLEGKNASSVVVNRKYFDMRAIGIQFQIGRNCLFQEESGIGTG